jgi:hypothetical protein
MRQQTAISTGALSSTFFPYRKLRSASGAEIGAGNHGSKWPYALLGIAAAVYILVHLFHFPATPIWRDGDQSVFLEHAERMANGEVLYRDLFQFNLPGTEYLYYFLFRCFGFRLSIPSLAIFPTLTAVTLLVYSLSRIVLNGLTALFPAIAFMVVCQHVFIDATHHWYSILLVLLTINLIARSRSPQYIAWAGVFLGLATVFTSSRGPFVALGVSLFFFWRSRSWREAARDVFTLLAPLFIVVGLVLIYLAVTVGPRTLFFSLVDFPLRYYSAADGNGFRGFFNGLTFGLRANSIMPDFRWLARSLAVPLLLLAFIATRFRKREEDLRESPRNQTLVLFALVGSCAFLAVLGSTSGLRLCCAAPFAFILGAVMLQEMGPRWMINWALAAVTIVAITEAGVEVARPVWTLHVPQGVVAIPDKQVYEEYDWIARHSCAGDQLIPEPKYNFVLGLRNPTKLDWLTPDAYTRPEQVRELLATLRQQPVRFIVWHDEVFDKPDPGNNLHPFFVFMKAHYRVGQHFSDGTEILVDDSIPAHCQLQE